MSNTAIVVPPSDETDANLARPVILKLRTPSSVATPTLSPTAESCSSAVFWSIAISSPPAGQRPSVKVNGLKRWLP